MIGLRENKFLCSVEKHLTFFEKYLTISDVISINVNALIHTINGEIIYSKPMYYSYKLGIINITYLVYHDLNKNIITMLSLDDIYDISF